MLCSTPATAQETWTRDLGYLTKDMTVTMAAQGGKFSMRDLRRIPQGANCNLRSGSLVRKTEDRGQEVMVRYLTAMQTESGFCPSFTPFVMSKADWDAARASYSNWYNRQPKAQPTGLNQGATRMRM